jgi:ABC-type glycerol-3-phosphate transport system substrate-binding protein
LGTFVEQKHVVPVADRILRDSNLNWPDVFDLVRLREATWDRQVYALPFGSSQFALWYRKDIWQGLGLPEPQTWEQYQAALVRIRDERGRLPELAEITFASAEPLAAGWGGQLLLARAAAYAQHRSFLAVMFNLEDMEPLIDGPPFVRALEELAASVTDSQSLEWGPQDTLARLLEGRAAAAIGWPSASMPDLEDAGKGFSLGVIEVPGSHESYDRARQVWDERSSSEPHVSFLAAAGRMGSVARRTRHERSAANLLVWLSGSEWGDQIGPASGAATVCRRAHLAAPARWVDVDKLGEEAGKEYCNVVARALQRGVAVSSLTIPGRSEYLAALDEAVARVIRQEAAAADSLRAAAKSWRAITAKHGIEAQRAAYKRSLGL